MRHFKRADIKLPPREFLTYLESILPGRVRDYAAEFESVLLELDDLPERTRDELLSWKLDLPDSIDKALGYVDPEGDDATRSTIAWLLDRIDNTTALITSEQVFQKRQYIEDLVDDIWNFADEGSMSTFRLARYIRQIREERAEVIDEIEYMAPDFSPSEVEKAESILELPEIWEDFQSALRKAAEKIETKLDYMAGRRPAEPEDVEHLYHASVHARDIAREGFADEVPGSGGLGGAQTTDIGGPKGTSFTADLYDAKQIMRALKEVAMIAQGDLGFRGVKEMAKQYNVWNTLMRERKYREIVNKREHRTEDVFELYNGVLWHSDRYNPVFIESSIVNDLANVSRSNIGIVEAAVNMEHPDIEYKSSMEEYRVPPEAILEVTDFIR